VQLVSKISYICADAPTLQNTDGWTGDMQTQSRALHYSASRGKYYSMQLSGEVTL